MTCESTPTIAATATCEHGAATTSRAADRIDPSAGKLSSACERAATPTASSAPGSTSPGSDMRRLKPWTVEQVIQRLQELAIDGEAPSRQRYDAQRGDLPICRTLEKLGHSWGDLLAAAGLKRTGPGNKPGSGKGFRVVDTPAETEAFIRNAFATAEPPRPSSWPMFGIHTKTETFRGRLPDGRDVQVTRQYYSLR